MRRLVLPVTAVIILWLCTATVRAQMFGQRNLGGRLTLQSRLQAEAVGTVAGNERLQNYLRGSRGAGGFVGFDRGTARRFVGTAQTGTSTYVRPAASDFRLERQQANLRQFYQPWQSRMYEPRLQVAFSFTAPPPTDRSTMLSRRLTAAASFDPANPIEVVLENETAILRGVVASDRARSLAERLALLEPGISEVRNELVVGPPERQATADDSPPEDRRQTAAPAESPAAIQRRSAPADSPSTPPAEP